MTTGPQRSQTQLDAALIDAAWANDVPRARRLIEQGADVNAKDDTEQSAYLIATSEGYLDLLELTLRHGAEVDSLDSFDGTGLIRAAERGHADIVGRLLRTDIAVDHVNNLGWIALHEAIVLGEGTQRYVDTVRLLVAGGTDVRITPERDGIAPVEHARTRGFDVIATTLERTLEGGPVADANRALLAAAVSGDADAARFDEEMVVRRRDIDPSGREPFAAPGADGVEGARSGQDLVKDAGRIGRRVHDDGDGGREVGGQSGHQLA